MENYTIKETGGRFSVLIGGVTIAGFGDFNTKDAAKIFIFAIQQVDKLFPVFKDFLLMKGRC